VGNDFREDLTVYEYRGKVVRLVSTSVWGERPPTSVLVHEADEDDDADVLLLVPDIYVAQLKHEGAFTGFLEAMRLFTHEMVDGHEPGM